MPLQAPGVAAHDLRWLQQGAPRLLRFSTHADHSRRRVVLSRVPEEAGRVSSTVRGPQLHGGRGLLLSARSFRHPAAPGDGAAGECGPRGREVCARVAQRRGVAASPVVLESGFVVTRRLFCLRQSGV